MDICMRLTQCNMNRWVSSIFYCIGLKMQEPHDVEDGRVECAIIVILFDPSKQRFLIGKPCVVCIVYTNIPVRWHSAFLEKGFSLNWSDSRLQPSILTERFAVNAAHASKVKGHRWNWQNVKIIWKEWVDGRTKVKYRINFGWHHRQRVWDGPRELYLHSTLSTSTSFLVEPNLFWVEGGHRWTVSFGILSLFRNSNIPSFPWDFELYEKV